jgi:putative PEP-CTERM system histidine kinase
MNSFVGTISYASAAVAFSILSLFLLVSWRGQKTGGLLIAATISTAIWGAILAIQAETNYFSLQIIFLVELIRTLFWVVFLLALSPKNSQKSSTIKISILLIFSLLFVNASWSFFLAPIGAWGTIKIQVAGQLLLAVLIVWLIEQVYRYLDQRYRWALKYLCLALAGLFAYDFFLYSEFALFQYVNDDLWVARGFISAFVVPFIAVSAVRNPGWTVEIFVSRQVIFHTSTLLVAGIYLILMATAGYYLRYFGGAWGVVFQTTFLFAGLMLLIVLFSSSKFRGKVRVYLSKHFFSNRFDYRQEWVKIIQTLSDESSDQTLNERVIDAISNIVDSQGGVLFLGYDRQRYEKVAESGAHLPLAYEPKDSPLSQCLFTQGWVIDLTEYRLNPEKYDHIALPEWLSVMPKAWLIIPMMFESQLIGFVVLLRSRSLESLHWEERDLVKTASIQAASYLIQRESALALTEAKQFEGFNRLSAFVIHDLKNLIAQLSLVVKNAQKHKANPAFIDDAIDTVDNSVKKMSNLMAHMRNGMTPVQMSDEEVNSVLQGVVKRRSVQAPIPEFQPANTLLFVQSPGERFAEVLSHIIQNAQEATDKSGRVSVKVQVVNESVMEILVEDTGCGMDEDFVRDRLFKPFDTTKGLTGMGIGVYESKVLIESMGGEIFVNSVPRSTLRKE